MTRFTQAAEQGLVRWNALPDDARGNSGVVVWKDKISDLGWGFAIWAHADWGNVPEGAWEILPFDPPEKIRKEGSVKRCTCHDYFEVADYQGYLSVRRRVGGGDNTVYADSVLAILDTQEEADDYVRQHECK